MFFKLLLLFTLIPLAELYLLLTVGMRIGLFTTIGIIILTGILGAALAKQEGFKTLVKAREAMNRGEVPADEMIEGLMILLAAGVLLTPGFLTDAFGFFLLIPPFRSSLRELVKHRIKANITVVGPPPMHQGQEFNAPPESETEGEWKFYSDPMDVHEQTSEKPDIVIDKPTDQEKEKE